jgi:hypothetical protein
MSLKNTSEIYYSDHVRKLLKQRIEIKIAHVIHFSVNGFSNCNEVRRQTGLDERTCRRWMNAPLDELLTINPKCGGPPHKDRNNGNMPREIKRILTRNKNRSSQKHAGIRHIKADLKSRNIHADRKAISRCLRKDMGLKPYTAKKIQHQPTDTSYKTMRQNWIVRN